MKNIEKIMEIVERAEKQGLIRYSKLSLMMDLELAHDTFNMRLDDLLKASDFDFAHDIAGIQNHIVRQDKIFEDYFVPRFATAED